MKATDAVTALAALAQEHRLAIFRLLVQAGVEGMPPGKIIQRLGHAAPTLSFHLAQLKQAGLVQVLRNGRSLTYTANYQWMNALLGFLTENCCAGDRADCRSGAQSARPLPRGRRGNVIAPTVPDKSAPAHFHDGTARRVSRSLTFRGRPKIGH